MYIKFIRPLPPPGPILNQQLLTTLKEHPDAWTRVDTILEYSQNQQTKYYALQVVFLWFPCCLSGWSQICALLFLHRLPKLLHFLSISFTFCPRRSVYVEDYNIALIV